MKIILRILMEERIRHKVEGEVVSAASYFPTAFPRCNGIPMDNNLCPFSTRWTFLPLEAPYCLSNARKFVPYTELPNRCCVCKARSI